MNRSVTFKSRLFANKEPQPHFINPRCFGEDLAAWLIERLGSARWSLSEPIQEDYGWGVWCRRGDDPYWIALSYCGDGPTEEPAEWVVSVNYDPGLNLIKRLFHKADPRAFSQLRDRVWQSLRSNRAIEIAP